MEDSDLFIMIVEIFIVIAVYQTSNLLMKKLNEIEEKTERLLKNVGSKIEMLEHTVKRIEVLKERFGDADMDFISDVLKDVDCELLKERAAQKWRLGKREREIAQKKEAVEIRNEYVKRKNAREVKNNT
jgi:hypothetical protein